MEEDQHIRLGGKSRILQVRKIRRGKGFTQAKRKRFLTVLAATCNVRLSAQAAGVNNGTIYSWRSADAAFAAQCRAAITAGYERLETALLARALGTDGAAAAAIAGMDLGDPEAILPEGEIDAELAIKLLNRHRATVEGRDRPMRPGRHIATREETDAALLKQLKVLRRQIEKSGGAMLEAPAPIEPDLIEHDRDA